MGSLWDVSSERFCFLGFLVVVLLSHGSYPLKPFRDISKSYMGIQPDLVCLRSFPMIFGYQILYFRSLAVLQNSNG